MNVMAHTPEAFIMGPTPTVRGQQYEGIHWYGPCVFFVPRDEAFAFVRSRYVLLTQEMLEDEAAPRAMFGDYKIFGYNWQQQMFLVRPEQAEEGK